MKKTLLLLLFLLFVVLIAPVDALAQGNLCPPGFANLCKLKAENAGGIVGSVWSLILIIAIFASLIFVAWGGVRWVTSNGDQQKVAAARSTIIAAIVGLVIALLTFFIVNMVTTFFTGAGVSGLAIPKLVGP